MRPHGGGAAVLKFDTLHQASSELEVRSTQAISQPCVLGLEQAPLLSMLSHEVHRNQRQGTSAKEG